MNRTHYLYVGTAGGAITIIILVALFLNYTNNNNTILSLWVKQKASSKEDEKKIFEQNKIYLCSTTFEKSTDFIKEYSIPIDCTQPVGIAIDHKDKIWIAATWIGYLVVFDPTLKGFVDFIKIPNWKTNGIFGSMVWGMDFDKNGNLWFTDEVHNAIWRYFTDERKFEIYQAPTKSSYPSQIAFDSQGRVWFSEIFGKKLGVINPSEVVNNTTKGIAEFGLDGKSNFATMGPVSISGGGNMLWLSAVSFPEGGQIIGFDINKQKFISFDLPKGTAIPIGVVEDSKRRLWINDHATNLFFMFDPSTGKMVKYSTSLPTSRNDTTTLPYWNIFRDGKVWFNEHEGNAIAYFNVANSTLVEYQIPSRAKVWGNTSNPLKFALDSKGYVWFTEWTENKIGVLDSEKLNNLPLWLDVSKDTIYLDRHNQNGNNQDGGEEEDSLQIFIHQKSYNNNKESKLKGPINMTIAGSMSPSGRLWNISSQFSENSFSFSDDDSNLHTVKLTLYPKPDVIPGNYTLTIGARYGTVTYSKMVSMIIK